MCWWRFLNHNFLARATKEKIFKNRYGKKSKKTEAADVEIISKIYLIRDKKIMLDRDLADLYDVTTGNLNKAVKRNIKRFPVDFMFQLTEAEFTHLIFQTGTSRWGGTRKMPYGFTEQGVVPIIIGIIRGIKQ